MCHKQFKSPVLQQFKQIQKHVIQESIYIINTGLNASLFFFKLLENTCACIMHSCNQIVTLNVQ